MFPGPVCENSPPPENLHDDDAPPKAIPIATGDTATVFCPFPDLTWTAEQVTSNPSTESKEFIHALT